MDPYRPLNWTTRPARYRSLRYTKNINAMITTIRRSSSFPTTGSWRSTADTAAEPTPAFNHASPNAQAISQNGNRNARCPSLMNLADARASAIATPSCFPRKTMPSTSSGADYRSSPQCRNRPTAGSPGRRLNPFSRHPVCRQVCVPTPSMHRTARIAFTSSLPTGTRATNRSTASTTFAIGMARFSKPTELGFAARMNCPFVPNRQTRSTTQKQPVPAHGSGASRLIPKIGR